MRRGMIGGLLAAISACTIACHTSQRTSGYPDGRTAAADTVRSVGEVDELLRGSVLYHRSNCRKCHYSGAASGLKARGPSLVDDEWLHCDGSVAGMKAVIMVGISVEKIHDKEQAQFDAMPSAAENDLSQEQVTAIAKYLHAIAQLDE